MSDLLPCPFCAQAADDSESPVHMSLSEHDWRDNSWTVQCDNCTATMGYSDSPDEAADAWNTRAALSASPKPAESESDLLRAAILQALDELNTPGHLGGTEAVGGTNMIAHRLRAALSTPKQKETSSDEAGEDEQAAEDQRVQDICLALLEGYQTGWQAGKADEKAKLSDVWMASDARAKVNGAAALETETRRAVTRSGAVHEGSDPKGNAQPLDITEASWRL